MSIALDPAEAARKDFLERKPNGEARMFYAGETPWHGLGKGVKRAQTSAKAIKLASLDKWNIHLEPFTANSGEASEDWRAIVRGLDNKVLSVSRPAYKPIQNEQGFEFLDKLVADRIMTYETAGSLMGGRKVWILAKMTEDMRIMDDEFVSYLLCVLGHDTFTSFSVYPTEVRVVCNNTYLQATRGKIAPVKIRHSGDVANKLEQAQSVLAVTLESQKRFKEWMVALGKKKMTNNDVTLVRDEIFGPLDDMTPTRRREAIAQFQAIYNAEREYKGQNGYAMLQAITGYGDHKINLRGRSDGEEHMLAALNGTTQAFKAKGVAILQSVTSVPAPKGLFAAAAAA